MFIRVHWGGFSRQMDSLPGRFLELEFSNAGITNIRLMVVIDQFLELILRDESSPVSFSMLPKSAAKAD